MLLDKLKNQVKYSISKSEFGLLYTFNSQVLTIIDKKRKVLIPQYYFQVVPRNTNGELFQKGEVYSRIYFCKIDIQKINRIKDYYLYRFFHDFESKMIPIDRNQRLMNYLFLKICTPGQFVSNVNESLVKGSLYHLIELIKSMHGDPGINAINNSENLYMKYLDLIEKYHAENYKVFEYANELRISQNQLNVACRFCVGKSAKRVLNNVRYILVKNELLKNNKSVNELAIDLGFSDSSNFIKFFKKESGISPHKFKLQYLLNEL